jgi:hypothetical protein
MDFQALTPFFDVDACQNAKHQWRSGARESSNTVPTPNRELRVALQFSAAPPEIRLPLGWVFAVHHLVNVQRAAEWASRVLAPTLRFHELDCVRAGGWERPNNGVVFGGLVLNFAGRFHG